MTETAGARPRAARWIRIAATTLLAGTLLGMVTGHAAAETRTLNLYYIHTKEKISVTYKKDGKYLKSGLDKLNRFLRDWRRNEPTRMDPQLFDMLWEVQRATRTKQPIHIVSAYRSPATNDMLRRTRGGQAEKSQHMLGKAIDFYIPGVKVSTIREIGFKMGAGGVGYYPKSGVPFVHLDTGNVRAWPRMSRSELARLFPDGKTLHLPPDGKPMPGYQKALAEYNARKRSGSAVAIANDGGGGRNAGERPKNLLAALFGGADEEEDIAEASVPTPRPAAAVAAAPAPAAPAPEPAPVPETPGTILASLPNASMPVPAAAPRRAAEGVPVAITPPAPVPAAAPEPVEAPAAVAELPDYVPPVPTRRPAVLVAAAEAPADRQSAAEIETALAAANTAAGSPVETVAAAPANAADEAAAILAAIAQSGERNAEVASVLPVPGLRPVTAAPEEPATVVAYAPPAPVPLVEPAALRPAPVPEVTAAPEGRAGRLPTPAAAPAQRPTPEEIVTAALDTGVATTPKSAKPSASDAAAVPPPVLPVQPADSARFAPSVPVAASLTRSGGVMERPEFAMNALRSAPDAVYTAGFSQTPPPADPNRLSGNAVTFLAVAKFSGGSGDGQPLTLQIPATN